LVKRNYVVSNKKLKGPPEPKGYANTTKLQTFRAAMRDHCRENWSHYVFAKTKGFTFESYADMIISQIATGQLRSFTPDDPTIKGACNRLMIPPTYKSIERYLGVNY
jgi:hypothetical protein